MDLNLMSTVFQLQVYHVQLSLQAYISIMIRFLFCSQKVRLRWRKAHQARNPFCRCRQRSHCWCFCSICSRCHKKCYEFLVACFESFCQEIDTSFDLKLGEPKTLNDVLCRFYAGLRNKKGDLYKKHHIWLCGQRCIATWYAI